MGIGGKMREIKSQFIKNIIKGQSFDNIELRQYVDDLLRLERSITEGIGGWSEAILVHNLKDRYRKEYEEILKELSPEKYEGYTKHEEEIINRQEKRRKGLEERERKKLEEEKKMWISVGGEPSTDRKIEIRLEMGIKDMKYDEQTVENLYQQNLTDAHQLLASLNVAEERKPNIKGLDGWIYEQTIRYCLCQELLSLGLSPKVEEQVPLYGRTKIDLLVGRVAIEIKALGAFGDDAEKYRRYRTKVEEKGWIYCYLTRRETHLPYRKATESAFGKERAFFLDMEGDWKRFIREVVKHLDTT